LKAPGAETGASIATTAMPASMASWIAGFSESLSAGLMSRMLTPFVIRSRIWAS